MPCRRAHVSAPRVNTTDPGRSPQNGPAGRLPWVPSAFITRQTRSMCFSAEADLAAGLIVGVVAVDALRHVRTPAQLPLAALPAIFSVHHLSEVLVWWSLQGQASPATGQRAAWFYLVVAFGVLPALVPLAVRAVETGRSQRRLLGLLVVAGTAVGLVLMRETLDGPIRIRIDGHHLVYGVGVYNDTVVTSAYVVATCGALLLSSYRPIQVYGVLNLAVVALLGWVQQNAVVSLWCVWAAITSVLVAVALRSAHEAVGPASSLRTTTSSQ